MIKVSQLQRGNGLLEFLGPATWHYDSAITADYEINQSVAVLFLSLKFHACKPEYIYKRINRLKEARVRLVMVLVDVPNYNLSLRELFSTVPLSIVLCRSHEECARYVRGFDLAERRSYDALRRGQAGVDSFLKAFPGINKTDCAGIRSSYGSVQKLLAAGAVGLAKIPGMGEAKAEGMAKYLKMPFKKR